jgi:hypothetical protein
MIKNYKVVDNILDEPSYLRNEFLKEKYFCKENFKLTGLNYYTVSEEMPDGNWRGFRTDNLTKKYPVHAGNLLNRIVSKATTFNTSAEGALYSHISTSQMTGTIKDEEGWHVDGGYIFAGVIYLSENPTTDSGTWLNINGRIKKIENKFNRLVMYKAGISHIPGNFFGKSAVDSRLTLTFFITKLCLKI